jgi:hypothetical protein
MTYRKALADIFVPSRKVVSAKSEDGLQRITEDTSA